MSGRVRLILAIHNHQPVGNFESVMEDAWKESYAPFLEVLKDYPDISIALHTSGSLIEWLTQAHPEYIDEVRTLVERGQIEILGGAFYEPILAGIPRRDRVGQIESYTRYLEQVFGTLVRGMWVPERVWEQSFAGDITEAGIEYTILDDYHFRCAGLGSDELDGYYLTEDEGRLLRIFPGSERLRYAIPFQDPEETIRILREAGGRCPDAVVTFGDDGEKFGTWPGTHKHVYRDGWIRRFFDMLCVNDNWLDVTTPSEAIDHVAPIGRCYLPDASYREMTEWALRPDAQQIYADLLHHETRGDPADDRFEQLKQFARGGIWRNFRIRYPESNEMYVRMLEISDRLARLNNNGPGDLDKQLLERARTELYRAQCNCPYWHGAFGGLYLPHLRHAIYRHLIEADTLMEAALGRDGSWVQIAAADFNLDARKEIRIASDRLIAYVAPASGGHMYELDIRRIGLNLLATLDRRPEAYHDRIRAAARELGNDGSEEDNGVASIHDKVQFKQLDLDSKITIDHWRRKSLVDHFLKPGTGLEAYRQGHGLIGDFVDAAYETVLRRSNERVEAVMTRQGHVGSNRVRLTKTVALASFSAGTLEARWEFENLPAGAPIHFAVELNFSGIAAGASDRYFYDQDGNRLGQVQIVRSLDAAERIGLIDEWQGLDISLQFSRPAGLWIFPIETVSQSEGGFELVHQSCAVIPRWEFAAPDDGRWSIGLSMVIDTSVAQARTLSEPALST